MRKTLVECKQKGEFHLLVKDVMLADRRYFFTYFRMSLQKYQKRLAMIVPYITKYNKRRQTIRPSERLSVTLRLATGDTQQTIGMSQQNIKGNMQRFVESSYIKGVYGGHNLS